MCRTPGQWVRHNFLQPVSTSGWFELAFVQQSFYTKWTSISVVTIEGREFAACAQA
ncbi:hypothetical protein KSX_89220 [Ktedonospora formicarum]|uniref:Uncharacterized protein n=1 Tax=Ktedonospora formicarum TaxID=2778364 RepID=A0A8J3I728_9CHLR|nr:hypothetical protein KSX_89220 [Ktedonospora formicarum]